jgi:hypothetical protein
VEYLNGTDMLTARFGCKLLLELLRNETSASDDKVSTRK